MEICPEILIVSTKDDYATDYITFCLNKINASYLRLNMDQLFDFSININPYEPELYGNGENFSFRINPNILRSIYFRAPVFWKDQYRGNLSPDQQFSHNQWAAFIHSLIIFEDVLWVNHPQHIYTAESKPYQLYKARKLGFYTPETIITNSNKTNAIFKKNMAIIKTLGSMMLNIENKDAFIYTNLINKKDLQKEDISSAPVILQETLIPKIDIRVTVIGKKAFAVSIKKNGIGIDIDWRIEKNVTYEEIELPKDIEKKCIKLTESLDLKYSGIDLLLHDDNYYFLEINPTGDWMWLINHVDLDIDEEIVKLLLEGKKCTN